VGAFGQCLDTGRLHVCLCAEGEVCVRVGWAACGSPVRLLAGPARKARKCACACHEWLLRRGLGTHGACACVLECGLLLCVPVCVRWGGGQVGDVEDGGGFSMGIAPSHARPAGGIESRSPSECPRVRGEAGVLVVHGVYSLVPTHSRAQQHAAWQTVRLGMTANAALPITLVARVPLVWCCADSEVARPPRRRLWFYRLQGFRDCRPQGQEVCVPGAALPPSSVSCSPSAVRREPAAPGGALPRSLVGHAAAPLLPAGRLSVFAA
jgi:hypothetical protein